MKHGLHCRLQQVALNCIPVDKAAGYVHSVFMDGIYRAIHYPHLPMLEVNVMEYTEQQTLYHQIADLRQEVALLREKQQDATLAIWCQAGCIAVLAMSMILLHRW